MVFEGIPKESYGRGKRMIADPFNKVTGVEDIYAIGDTCIQTHDPAFPNGHPQVAQVAMQQGKLLAKNLEAVIKGKPLIPFHYHDKGTMAIIGRNKAVADLPAKTPFQGIHCLGHVAVYSPDLADQLPEPDQNLIQLDGRLY